MVSILCMFGPYNLLTFSDRITKTWKTIFKIELLIFENECHAVLKYENRVVRHKTIADFLA